MSLTPKYSRPTIKKLSDALGGGSCYPLLGGLAPYEMHSELAPFCVSGHHLHRRQYRLHARPKAVDRGAPHASPYSAAQPLSHSPQPLSPPTLPHHNSPQSP